ncbi:MAG: lytic transglycosylase domain-containing protein [Xanthomonadales bacterium]|jgi:soluble lytic murein transglycosylase-like protein|nr:lytic transglycosylase domain-containing protein [Xanthomonadales bacterium]
MLALAVPAWAQIYKWTDDKGIVHFSSEKPPGNTAVEAFRFPCYASDPSCSARVNWNTVPLNRAAFPEVIREVAAVHGVDESLIRAIIHAESAYQPDAKSPKGAQGLMQLMPPTQAELGVEDPYDPIENIEGGTRYLAGLLKRFRGDVRLASAAYNAGPGAVERYQGIPPYPETEEYVRRVAILHRRYRGAP